MPLNSKDIKQQLSEIYLCNKKDIKRISKKKDAAEAIERIFQINDFLVSVRSDLTDTKIIKISKKVQDPIIENNLFSDYYFAIGTNLIENSWFLVSIIKKDFWDANHYCDDQPCEIEYLLPEYIGDLNESSEMAVYLDNWEIAFNDLRQRGMQYNNELARFLEAHCLRARGMHLVP
jgi:hypothetical protein